MKFLVICLAIFLVAAILVESRPPKKLEHSGESEESAQSEESTESGNEYDYEFNNDYDIDSGDAEYSNSESHEEILLDEAPPMMLGRAGPGLGLGLGRENLDEQPEQPEEEESMEIAIPPSNLSPFYHEP